MRPVQKTTVCLLAQLCLWSCAALMAAEKAFGTKTAPSEPMQLLCHLSFDDYGNNGLNVLKVQGGQDAVVRVNPNRTVTGLGSVKCVTDKSILAGLAEGDGAVEIPSRTHVALPIPSVLTNAPGRAYTIAMKVRFKDFDHYNCLLNMPADNRQDVMAFLERNAYPFLSLKLREPKTTGGRGGFYPGEWVRLVFQFGEQRTRVLLDGREICTQNIALAGSRADCRRAGGYFLLSADDNGDDHEMYWADVKVYDGVVMPEDCPEVPAAAQPTGELLCHLSFDDHGNNGLNALKVHGGQDAVVRVNPDKAVTGLGEVTCITDKAILAGLAEGDGAVEIPCRTHVALPIPSVLSDNPRCPYTIAMKVKFKDFDHYNCILSMPSDNRQDVMSFLERGVSPKLSLKVRGSKTTGADGGFASGEWAQLVFQFDRGETRVLLNGREVCVQTVGLAGSRADCSKAGGYFLLSADNDGEDAPMYWADVKVYDGIVTPEDCPEVPAAAPALVSAAAKASPLKIVEMPRWDSEVKQFTRDPKAAAAGPAVAAEPEMDDEPIEIMSDPAREAKLRERRKDPARAAAAAKFLLDL